MGFSGLAFVLLGSLVLFAFGGFSLGVISVHLDI